MATKKRGHKEYGIYFDESAKDGVYVFTAAVVENSKKRALDRHLLAIRREMTAAVLKVAPHLLDHPKLAHGKLLEIHAVDLYQSGGIFREVKRIDGQFWHHQHEWLRRTLELGAGLGVKYFYFPATDELIQNTIQTVGDPRIIYRDLKYKTIGERYQSIVMNPYFLSLLAVMHMIDDSLAQEGAVGQLFCHTYDEANSYSTIQSYALVQSAGHYTNISQPVFRTCSQEQCIQLADAAGYVLLQDAHSHAKGKSLKPEFSLWDRKYVRPMVQRPGNRPSPSKYLSIGTLLFEMFVSKPGGPPAFQRHLKRLWAARLAEGHSSARSNEQLVRLALELAEAETNKPPSEDGDLYT